MLIVFLELLESEEYCIYLLNQGNGKSVIQMNDIIYLDLCKHPFYVNISDVRVRGSG